MEKFSDRTVELRQKIANLRKQCNEYDSLLKHFSLQCIDLPANMQKDLDEHTQFKRKLGLYEMDLVFLSEFECINTEKNIEKNMSILKIKRNHEDIEKQLEETNHKLAEAKSFVETMRNDYKHVRDMDRVLRDANLQIETLEEKKSKLKNNIIIDFDRILMKLEQLAK